MRRGATGGGREVSRGPWEGRAGAPGPRRAFGGGVCVRRSLGAVLLRGARVPVGCRAYAAARAGPVSGPRRGCPGAVAVLCVVRLTYGTYAVSVHRPASRTSHSFAPKASGCPA